MVTDLERVQVLEIRNGVILKKEGMLSNSCKVICIVHSLQIVDDISDIMHTYDKKVDYIVTNEMIISIIMWEPECAKIFLIVKIVYLTSQACHYNDNEQVILPDHTTD
jgi:transcriptional regulatory protein LevR